MPKRKPRKLPHIPPDEELRRIISAADLERDRLILLLMLLAGLRVSEVCKLEVPHLNFRTKLLFINQGKGGKDAFLPIPKHLLGPLRGWCASRKDGPVFRSPRGGFLTSRAVQLLVKRCAVKAGLYGATEKRRYHPHSFRGGCATEMMRRKVPMPVIQRVLRHSNLNTTMVYCNVVPEDLRAALDG